MVRNRECPSSHEFEAQAGFLPIALSELIRMTKGVGSVLFDERTSWLGAQ